MKMTREIHVKFYFYLDCKGSNMQGLLTQHKRIQKLSKDEIQHVTHFLRPKDIRELSRTSRFFHETTQENPVWEDKLTPEAQRKIDVDDSNSACALFRDVEENRLSQYRSVAYIENYFQKNAAIGRLNNSVIKYIKNGHLSLEAALNLTDKQRSNLESDAIQEYIDKRRLTFEAVLNLTDDIQILKLKHPGVQKYIVNGRVSVDEALHTFKLTRQHEFNLRSVAVQKYIDGFMLNFAAALHLNAIQRSNLESVAVQKYIDDFMLNFAAALHLTDIQRSNLESVAVQKYIDNGSLSLDKALKLTDRQRDKLESKDGKSCIIS